MKGTGKGKQIGDGVTLTCMESSPALVSDDSYIAFTDENSEWVEVEIGIHHEHLLPRKENLS